VSVSNEQTENQETQTEDALEVLQPLISLASALLDNDRLRIAGLLAGGPASRVEMSEPLGISHKDLLRHLDSLQNFGVVKLQEPAPRDPDPYSRYELNAETFRIARQAMGKYKGVRKRPSDSRLMTLETFMPDGKLRAMPLKQSQIIVILDEISLKFDFEKQYSEREVNTILKEISEDDYATIRRYLVDYGYLNRTRDGSVYRKNA
jgi:predicted transcriptional regulator